ncbi:EpsG family protein [Vibrio alginolyticus]|uniref:EpsG family protein n=2 Tax=Vibrio alginolyticus TaxID=663 RepID=UPI001BD22444|nr:EpsG family protein [Vibrio alginolyticus]MBS9866978.1 EpsG family protein [Vibrio alginolyticus]
MTYELLYYLFMAFIGALFCVQKLRSERLYFFLTFFLFFIYSIVTRYSGFDIDINTYASSLKSEVFSLYYLKEPVYWVSSRYIYKITQSPEITFILYDIISFVLVLKARKNMKLPQYFPYLFLLFFPAVMGINNVYRQYLSYTIFLYFTSLLFVGSGFIKKSFFILLSVLTHNVSALFAPLFFTLNKKRQISFRSVFLYLCVIILLPFALGTKSNSDTGTLGVGVYLFVMVVLFIFYILSYRMVFNDIPAKFFYYLIFLLSLTSVSAVLMGSAQSKRVGMYALMITLIPIVKAIEDNYKQKRAVRIIVYIVLILPTIIFSSSLNMLLTQYNP